MILMPSKFPYLCYFDNYKYTIESIIDQEKDEDEVNEDLIKHFAEETVLKGVKKIIRAIRNYSFRKIIRLVLKRRKERAAQKVNSTANDPIT